MKRIQIALGEDLLQATDRAARSQRINRSALVRDALRAYLRVLASAERERQDRAGYLLTPDSEFEVWGAVAAWPGD